jgi:GST-like protein
MIDLYYWPTPNGHKITIFLEETGIEYKIVPINIRKGEQFAPEFLKISPNNRMPAIVDSDGPGGNRFRSSSRARFCSILRRRPAN